MNGNIFIYVSNDFPDFDGKITFDEPTQTKLVSRQCSEGRVVNAFNTIY